MKFISAFQRVDILAAEIEDLIQEDHLSPNDFKVLCLDERRDDIESMVSVPVETVSEDELDNDFLIDKYGVEDSSLTTYINLIRSGGYILIGEESIEDGDKDQKLENTANQNEWHAPGFGVNLREPKSDKTNHEDNFNPDNPNPQTDL